MSKRSTLQVAQVLQAPHPCSLTMLHQLREYKNLSQSKLQVQVGSYLLIR